jgi:hypothetical protein
MLNRFRAECLANGSPEDSSRFVLLAARFGQIGEDSLCETNLGEFEPGLVCCQARFLRFLPF